MNLTGRILPVICVEQTAQQIRPAAVVEEAREF
jgi:hypothetical protein